VSVPPAYRKLEIAAPQDAGETLAQVARWLHGEWGAFHGADLEDTRVWLQGVLDNRPEEALMVACADGEPVGVALLVACDLPERSELTPWLSSLYVLPEWRGKTIGRRLVGAITMLARHHGHARLYLYTSTPRLYEKLGWRDLETLAIDGRQFRLMEKALVD